MSRRLNVLPGMMSRLCRIASVTKLFTATAVMQLRDAGRLQLDDPVAKYLPWFTIRTHDADAPPITIRHLLTHTSGLRDQWSLIQLARGRFEENRITEADVMDIVPRQKALNFAPGAEYLYSNTGFTLSGTSANNIAPGTDLKLVPLAFVGGSTRAMAPAFGQERVLMALCPVPALAGDPGSRCRRSAPPPAAVRQMSPCAGEALPLRRDQAKLCTTP